MGEPLGYIDELERGAQALREYELKHDLREPWAALSEHHRETWRQAFERLNERFLKYGILITAIGEIEEEG